MDWSMVNAAIASVVGQRLICFPIDTLTVRRQTLAKQPKIHLNIRSIRGLYQGLTPSIALVTPGYVMYLVAYRYVKEQSKPITGEGLLNYCTAATAAEMISSMLWTPMEVIKARSQISSNASSWHQVKTVYNTYGIHGFFRGYMVGLAIYVPYASMWWCMYEKVKNKISSNPYFIKSQFLSTSISPFIASGLATGTVGAAFAPLEMIKTRYQVSGSADVYYGSGGAKQSSIPQIIRDLYRENGARSFFKGFGYRLLYIVPSGMINMAIFEYMKPDLELERGMNMKDE